MQIGIDASRAWRDKQTGTELYAYQLIKELIPRTAERHQLRLYFNQPPAQGLFAHAPHVEQVVLPFPRLWTHVRLARELHRRPPDLFFTPAHVIPLTYFGPSIATIHDLGYYHFPRAHPRRQLAYLWWSTRHNARRSRLIVADSQATKADLIRWLGIAPHKIHVLYPGANHLAPPLASVAPPDVPQPYLLFMGTLQPRKNLVRVVEAFGHLANVVPHHLVLAGRVGWRATSLLEAIDQQPAAVRQRIHLPGYVPHAQKAALIAGATLLLYPSLYEGFGFPLLEGNVCGTAVIASHSSSLPELAGEGAAWLVDPQNTAALTKAMYTLLTDAGQRQQLIAKGYANVRRFAWGHTAEQLLTLIEAMT